MSQSAPTPLKVYASILDIASDLSKEGIAKGRHNKQQGYAFRGIDDIYNTLSGLLVKHSLVIIPKVLDWHQVERKTNAGGNLFFVTVKVQFAIVSALDGSNHVAETYGEAMDSADKATNKAQSAAYKYMAMQVFCIPTEGENDADYSSPPPTQPVDSRRNHREPEVVANETETRKGNGQGKEADKFDNLPSLDDKDLTTGQFLEALERELEAAGSVSLVEVDRVLKHPRAVKAQATFTGHALEVLTDLVFNATAAAMATEEAEQNARNEE